MSARVITTLSLAKNKPHITLKVEGFKQRVRGRGGTVPSQLPIPPKYIAMVNYPIVSGSSSWRLSFRLLCIFIKSRLSSKFLCEVLLGRRRHRGQGGSRGG